MTGIRSCRSGSLVRRQQAARLAVWGRARVLRASRHSLSRLDDRRNALRTTAAHSAFTRDSMYRSAGRR